MQDALPAALVPLIALVAELPSRTSGKVDRAALPWPLVSKVSTDQAISLTGTAGWVAQAYGQILAQVPTSLSADFFASGGGSLTAAQLVSKLRARYPEVTVADLYAHPTIGSMTEFLESKFRTLQPARVRGTVAPTRRRTQSLQVALSVLIATITGARWMMMMLLIANIVGPLGGYVDQVASWWLVGIGTPLLLAPFGRMAIAVAGTRMLLGNLTPGSYPRSGRIHVRLWAAERLNAAVGAASLAGAPWMPFYARALGCTIGKDIDLHSLPPVTGMLRLGRGCSIEPEVDLSGYWIDGDLVHIGIITIADGASIGARSVLGPNCTIGEDSDIAPGSAVFDEVPAGECWIGSPARRMGRVDHPWPQHAPPRGTGWAWVYGISSIIMALVPVIAAIIGLLVLLPMTANTTAWPATVGATMAAVPLAALAAFGSLMVRLSFWCGALVWLCGRARSRCEAGSVGKSGRPNAS